MCTNIHILLLRLWVGKYKNKNSTDTRNKSMSMKRGVYWRQIWK